MNTGARIRTERRLAAILAADIAGYSRLIGAEEESTLQRLRSVRAEEIDPKIANHRVRLVKTTGIGLAHRIRRRCRCTTLCCRGGVGDASAQLGFRSALTPISANFFMPPKETGPESGSQVPARCFGCFPDSRKALNPVPRN